tara:strand:- start:2475 stop:3305 length:831 start_codon:yes stop_codon:yes gene_type:complete
MNTNTQLSGTTLVIGGTGKTGRRVLQGLQENNVSVRLGSRSADPSFDWENPSTWSAALEGVSSVYLTFYPDLAVPHAPSAIKQFCYVARHHGVQHIVLLSGRGEPAAQQCEDIVKVSGIPWTIIRASWFNQNFSEGAFYDMVKSGVIALPIGDVGEPFVDTDDIAEVAIKALTEPGHVNKLYEVTGPRLLTFKAIAEELSKALDKKIKFIPISTEVFEQEMIKQHVPIDTIQMLLFLFNEVLDGRNEYISHGVQEALGRPAKDFSAFAKELNSNDA